MQNETSETNKCSHMNPIFILKETQTSAEKQIKPGSDHKVIDAEFTVRMKQKVSCRLLLLLLEETGREEGLFQANSISTLCTFPRHQAVRFASSLATVHISLASVSGLVSSVISVHQTEQIKIRQKTRKCFLYESDPVLLNFKLSYFCWTVIDSRKPAAGKKPKESDSAVQ